MYVRALEIRCKIVKIMIDLWKRARVDRKFQNFCGEVINDDGFKMSSKGAFDARSQPFRLRAIIMGLHLGLLLTALELFTKIKLDAFIWVW